MKFKELIVYQKAFKLAMNIYAVSKKFPKEEQYSLTDQIRRSSRSVCANFGEAYRKRIFPKHFVSNLTDCDAENTETNIWLDFALSCNYIEKNIYDSLVDESIQIGKLLNNMINNPDRFL